MHIIRSFQSMGAVQFEPLAHLPRSRSFAIALHHASSGLRRVLEDYQRRVPQYGLAGTVCCSRTSDSHSSFHGLQSSEERLASASSLSERILLLDIQHGRFQCVRCAKGDSLFRHYPRQRNQSRNIAINYHVFRKFWLLRLG